VASLALVSLGCTILERTFSARRSNTVVFRLASWFIWGRRSYFGFVPSGLSGVWGYDLARLLRSFVTSRPRVASLALVTLGCTILERTFGTALQHSFCSGWYFGFLGAVFLHCFVPVWLWFFWGKP
jgi:hypothetical protein